MMGLIDDEPVRSPRARVKFLEAWEQGQKIGWTVLEGDAEQVDTERTLRFLENLENFRCGGKAFRATERYKLLEIVVVALRVDQADLVVTLNQALQQR